FIIFYNCPNIATKLSSCPIWRVLYHIFYLSAMKHQSLFTGKFNTFYADASRLPGREFHKNIVLAGNVFQLFTECFPIAGCSVKGYGGNQFSVVEIVQPYLDCAGAF